MSLLRRYLSRRWPLVFLGVAALLFGLTMVHPYPRQSLFGPTIRGKPACYWETEIRERVAHLTNKPSWESKLRKWLGVPRKGWLDRSLVDDEEMITLLLQLTRDDDKDVRTYSVWAITYHENLWQEASLPVLREQLQDDDPMNRTYAAQAIWRIAKDKEVVSVLRAIIRAPDGNPPAGLTVKSYHRATALAVLSEIGAEIPECFLEIVSFATSNDESMRASTVFAMRRFGKKGMPIVLKGLVDPSDSVRITSANTLRIMGSGAREAVPELKGRLTDDSVDVRCAVIEALVAIDSKEHEHLKANP